MAGPGGAANPPATRTTPGHELGSSSVALRKSAIVTEPVYHKSMIHWRARRTNPQAPGKPTASLNPLCVDRA
jgi:hypothetical protein